MKKLLIVGFFVACCFQLSVARVVTVIPYAVDVPTGKRLVLVGRQFHTASFLSAEEKKHFEPVLRNGVWTLPQFICLFAHEDPLRVAGKMFNEKTMYSFVTPYNPNLTGREAGLFECCPQGAYAKRACLDQAIESMIYEQLPVTPVVRVHDHYYFFLQVPQVIAAQFLRDKRAFLQEVYPGYIVDEPLPQRSQIVGKLGADFEEFTWVDGAQLVQFLQHACTVLPGKMDVVLASSTAAYEFDYTFLISLRDDTGALDAFARVLCPA